LTVSYEGRLAGFRMAAALEHVDPRNKTPGANFDKVLPRRASNSGKFAVDRDIGVFGAGLSLRAVDDRYDNAANTLKVPGYATFDLRTEWRFTPQWTLAAHLNNVANKRYETVYGYNQPGREGYLTLRYSQR
jgi:vitamin B12 transporter